jgi:ribosomal protein S18 acetylase RimI-like enzyme
LIAVELRDLVREELVWGAGIAARGMRDNPIHVAAWGDDPRHRLKVSERMFRALLAVLSHPPIAAWRGRHAVGVVGMSAPGVCPLALRQVMRMLPRQRPLGPADMRRTLSWLNVWRECDPDEPHWHLGPVAVEPGLQGMGIGGQMMEEFGRRMDRERAVAYLETDKLRNVVFYERFGFETMDERTVLGVPNWFMRRPAPAAG